MLPQRRCSVVLALLTEFTCLDNLPGRCFQAEKALSLTWLFGMQTAKGFQQSIFWECALASDVKKAPHHLRVPHWPPR